MKESTENVEQVMDPMDSEWEELVVEEISDDELGIQLAYAACW